MVQDPVARQAHDLLSHVGLFFLPLWRYFPVHQVYTWIVGFSFIVVSPLLAMAAVRICGASLAAAAIGGLLFLCHGPDFFRWAFEFGTMPGVFSTCFGLIFVAGLFRAAWFPRRGLGLAVALVLGGSFFLLWPPAGLIAGAIVLPNTIVGPNEFWGGVPAKKIRDLPALDEVHAT